MCSDQDIVWFITTPKYLNESDLSIAEEFTLRETSKTSLSFRELPKTTKLHLEILKSFCLREWGRLGNEGRPILLKIGTHTYREDLCDIPKFQLH